MLLNGSKIFCQEKLGAHFEPLINLLGMHNAWFSVATLTMAHQECGMCE